MCFGKRAVVVGFSGRTFGRVREADVDGNRARAQVGRINIERGTRALMNPLASRVRCRGLLVAGGKSIKQSGEGDC